MKVLLAKLAQLEVEAKGLLANADAKAEDITAKMEDIKNVKAKIEAQKVVDQLEADRIAAEAQANTPVNTPVYAQAKSNAAPKLFKNLVDQLVAVKAVATEGRVDERLVQLNKFSNAALGGNEGTGADGGFAVQTDYAGLMMESAVKESGILNLVDSYEVTDGSNSVKWVDVDETSVATTVFGGVQVYWASEAAAVAASNPKLTEKELKLEKLMGLAYATYELEADSSFVNTLYTRAFTTGIRRELENAIIAGDGKGKPIGFQTGGGVVSVAKEAGQAAATILWENLSKMYHRSLDKSSMAWLMHPDCAEQLDFLAFPVGVGGVPVYLPASAAGTIDTLRGKPILESDHCAALGTVGDVNLVDLKQYMLAYKGGIDAATSMHVQFLTAQNCFRFIFRANGMPKKNSALTIKNSANKRSSFITLATRG
ncbi:phage major capsid protein [Desulfosporosinus lacus]|uniref:Phage major capsid protein, HK97 family n=1 Tax=Desulfosporosinus lacus DSM 15449 TaxID=1121420 RepID=A0A1M5WGT3_9FIRM|nr:phage major capsid protein [Desulfosporosinus lacus]SHH86759.1 phage major capsid protein, HK97 family [Desulfosporosinus lacus DSM 15449]